MLPQNDPGWWSGVLYITFATALTLRTLDIKPYGAWCRPLGRGASGAFPLGVHPPLGAAHDGHEAAHSRTVRNGLLPGREVKGGIADERVERDPLLFFSLAGPGHCGHSTPVPKHRGVAALGEARARDELPEAAPDNSSCPDSGHSSPVFCGSASIAYAAPFSAARARLNRAEELRYDGTTTVRTHFVKLLLRGGEALHDVGRLHQQVVYRDAKLGGGSSSSVILATLRGSRGGRKGGAAYNLLKRSQAWHRYAGWRWVKCAQATA